MLQFPGSIECFCVTHLALGSEAGRDIWPAELPARNVGAQGSVPTGGWVGPQVMDAIPFDRFFRGANFVRVCAAAVL